MASTYTANQGLEKPATGDRSGTWGTMTNTNMDMLDRSISGVGALSLTGTTTTLTTTDGSASDGNYKVLVLGGSPSGPNTITLSPNDGDKLYFVVNSTGQSVIFSQGTGANVTIANGAADIIYADGAGSGAAVASVLANDLVFKTGDGVILNLQTSDTTVTAASVLGRLNFTAPDEASGTDAILLAASIAAISEGTFAADNNATKLSFLTGASAAASEVMSISSVGNVTMKQTATTDDTPMTLLLQTGELDVAASDVLGKIQFQAPDEATGTDAILVAAEIAAVSEGDFSSSNNATKLSFMTGASEAASEKMSLSSAGNLGIGIAPTNRFHIKQSNNGETGSFRTERSDTTAYGVIYMGGDDDLYIQNQTDGDINFYTNSALAMTLDSSGNLAIANAAGPVLMNEAATVTNPTLVPDRADLDTGVGWVSANIGSLVAGGTSAMRWSATGVGVLMSPTYPLDVYGTGGTAAQISRWADQTPTQYVGIYNANNGGDTPNTANATLTVRGMATSTRSINAGGTVNASGADYAEYMTKAVGCGTIAKGAVCGVNADGKLTDVYADAHSFVIKSTDPSYVGGDKWGLASTDSDGNETMLEGDALEAARQKVDRISFSGQVPCTIAGDAAVGDYIIPQAKDDGIEAVAVSNPTFDQYRLAVGKIWKLGETQHLVAVKIG